MAEENNTDTSERILETGHEGSAYQHRRFIAWIVFILFSTFVMIGKALWGGIKGFCAGISDCWKSEIVPFIKRTPKEGN